MRRRARHGINTARPWLNTASWLGRLGNRRKRRLRHVRMRSVDHMFKVSHHRVSDWSRDRVSYRSLDYMMRRVRHMRMPVPHVRRMLMVGMRHIWIRLRIERHWIMVMGRRKRVVHHLIKVMSRGRRHVRVQMRVVHHGIIINHMRMLHALSLWWISQVVMDSLRWRFGRERSLSRSRCFNDLSRLGDFGQLGRFR